MNNLLLSSGSSQTDPGMTVDRSGNFYCNYDDFAQNSGLAVIKSTNKGLSWTGPYTVCLSVDGHFNDKGFSTCDRTNGAYDGNIYVAWSDFWPEYDTSSVGMVRSTDGGLTFGDRFDVSPANVVVDDGSRFLGSDLFVQPLVGADGAVYTFYSGYDGSLVECDSSSSLYMSKSTDGGLTWPIVRDKIYQYDGLRCRVVHGNIDAFCCPAGDVDITGGPYDGNIYISSLDFIDDGPFNHGEIVLLKSTDGGTTWKEPVRVNDDPLGYDVDQFHPWLTVNQNGAIAVIFYDQRIDPGHTLFDVFAAYSFDGGETFSTNHRITNVSSDPIYLGKAGTIAEYIGVTAFNDKVTAVWTDLRNQNQDVYSATYDIPLLEPRLLEVANGSYLASAPDGFSWGHAWYTDDINYRLEVSSDPAFSSLILNENLTANLFTLSGEITEDGFYYWRVKAFRASQADSSEYSDVWFFGLDCNAPTIPVPVAPAAGASTREYQPEFAWSVASGNVVAPEYFEIEISDNASFTGGTYYHHAEGISETSYVLPEELPAEGTYYWRVNHYDLAENESGYIDGIQFSLINYICGDANGDLKVNVGDAVFLVNLIFHEGSLPDPPEAGNVNCDTGLNIGDAVYLINYIFGEDSPIPCEGCR